LLIPASIPSFELFITFFLFLNASLNPKIIAGALDAAGDLVRRPAFSLNRFSGDRAPVLSGPAPENPVMFSKNLISFRENP